MKWVGSDQKQHWSEHESDGTQQLGAVGQPASSSESGCGGGGRDTAPRGPRPVSRVEQAPMLPWSPGCTVWKAQGHPARWRPPSLALSIGIRRCPSASAATEGPLRGRAGCVSRWMERRFHVGKLLPGPGGVPFQLQWEAGKGGKGWREQQGRCYKHTCTLTLVPGSSSW